MRKLLLLALTLASCSKEECTDYVSHFTRQKDSDVFKLIDTYPGSDKPTDYTEGRLEHLFILETNCK